MNILFTGDLHIHNHLGNPHYIGKVGEYLEHLRKYCIENKISHAVILGDTFNCNQIINHEALLLAMNKFHDFKDAGITLFIVTGNHDMYKKGKADRSLTQVFSRSFMLPPDYGSLVVGNAVLHFKNHGDSVEADRFKLEEGKYNILCSHLELNNFKMGNITVEGHIDHSVLGRFDLVVNGHHHDHEARDNVVLPGNPYHKDFSDVGKKKGFVVVDTDEKKWEFVEYDGLKYFEIDMDTVGHESYSGSVLRLRYDPEKVSVSKLVEIKSKLRENNLYVDAVKKKSAVSTGSEAEVNVELKTFDDAFSEYLEKFCGELDPKILMEKYAYLRSKVKK